MMLFSVRGLRMSEGGIPRCGRECGGAGEEKGSGDDQPRPKQPGVRRRSPERIGKSEKIHQHENRFPFFAATMDWRSGMAAGGERKRGGD